MLDMPSPRTRSSQAAPSCTPSRWTAATGLSSWIDAGRNRVRRRIQATYHPDAAPMGRALVLGETDLKEEDRRAFQLSGLAHLLAVSGTHLILSVVAAATALRAILVRIPAIAERWDAGSIAAATAIPLAWLYADFAGGGGSAMRAAAMLTASMAARMLGRRPQAARAVSISIVVAWCMDPLCWFDPSFSLSAAATLGLICLSRPFADAMRLEGSASTAPLFRRALRGLLTAMSSTLAATLACTPILLFLSPGVPTLAVFANVIAAPLGELCALPVCLLHAVSSPLPALESGAAKVGSGALLLVRDVAHLTEDAKLIRSLPPPTPMQCCSLLVFFVWSLDAHRRSVKRVQFAIAAVLLTVSTIALEAGATKNGAPRDRLRLSVLDVGQARASLSICPMAAACSSMPVVSPGPRWTRESEWSRPCCAPDAGSMSTSRSSATLIQITTSA